MLAICLVLAGAMIVGSLVALAHDPICLILVRLGLLSSDRPVPLEGLAEELYAIWPRGRDEDAAGQGAWALPPAEEDPGPADPAPPLPPPGPGAARLTLVRPSGPRPGPAPDAGGRLIPLAPPAPRPR